MSNDDVNNDNRFGLRKKYAAKGKVSNGGPGLPELTEEPSFLERHFFGTCKAGKFLTKEMRDNFFEPTNEEIEEIRDPKHYSEKLHKDLEQTAYDNDKQFQLWISEPDDKQKGYVVYFEGMAGHFGDLGNPSLVKSHNKAARKEGRPESVDADPENRDYRLKRIKALQEEGFGVIAVHLPGFGASKGEPTEENYYNAIDEALIPWLESETQDIDLDKLTVLGASQGTASAAYLAKRLNEKEHPPQLLTLVAPPLSAADSILDGELQDVPNIKKRVGMRNQAYFLKDRFAIADMMPDISPDTKILVVGGGKDWWVPKHHVDMVAHAAEQSGHETQKVFDDEAEHMTLKPDWIVANMRAFQQNNQAIDPRVISLPGDGLGFTANISRDASSSLQR